MRSSPRRLDHVVKAYSSQRQSETIDLCVARFDDDTKESFLNLYSKIDATGCICSCRRE